LQAAQELLADDQRVRAELARRRLARVLEIDGETAELKHRIAGYVTASGTSLTSIYGIGPIIAARFLSEVVDINRYPNRNAFASVNGTAPLAASSGRTQRHRYNPGGNRRLNKCLYTIAITQARADTEGRAYYLRKREAGKTSKEALRCLKRRLSDIVYSTMRRDADGVVDAASATRARPTAKRPAA
jgi:transposase